MAMKGRLRGWAIPVIGAAFFAVLVLGRSRTQAPPAVEPEAARTVADLVAARDTRGLVALLSDPDLRVSIAAAETLARLRDRSVIADVQALYPSRPAAVALAGLAGPDEIDTIYDMFHSSDPVIRRCGTEAMGRLDPRAYDTVVRERLADPDETVRVTAARQIHRNVPRAQALEHMRWALAHPDPAIRRTAAIELSAYAADAAPILRDHHDDDDRVRLAVASSLKRVGG